MACHPDKKAQVVQKLVSKVFVSQLQFENRTDDRGAKRQLRNNRNFDVLCLHSSFPFYSTALLYGTLARRALACGATRIIAPTSGAVKYSGSVRPFPQDFCRATLCFECYPRPRATSVVFCAIETFYKNRPKEDSSLERSNLYQFSRCLRHVADISSNPFWIPAPVSGHGAGSVSGVRGRLFARMTARKLWRPASGHTDQDDTGSERSATIPVFFLCDLPADIITPTNAASTEESP